MPAAAITTDVIVGFPGETEQDFADTLDLVREARFAGAFTFQYSIRPGTPAATCRIRFRRPSSVSATSGWPRLSPRCPWQENRKLVGTEVEVLVADGEGRKDSVTHRMSGRARDNRLVHFTPPDPAPRPGDIITTVVTSASPHYLLADSGVGVLRRTRGGDNWAVRQAAPAVKLSAATIPANSVLLGMPSVGVPAQAVR